MNRSEAGMLGYLKNKKFLDKKLEERKKQALEKYEVEGKCCTFCGKRIPFEKRSAKFCNHSCSASYTNKVAGRRERVKALICECGVIASGYNKYCDMCISLNKHVAMKKVSFDDLKSEKTRRTRLIEELGRSCQICGLTEWRGKPAPVIMDHIDGNPENNIRSNFRLICPNCDAQLETYKGKNKGSGRWLRRQKRRLGLCL
jgi:hypothetical protein